MATLDFLKAALRRQVETTSSTKRPLTDEEYSAGFDILVKGPGWTSYRDFIIPQLSQLLVPLLKFGHQISILEIGPGPQSLFGHLSAHLRRGIKKYTAFEPNGLFAERLEEWLCSNTGSENEFLFSCLETPPIIHRIPFTLQHDKENSTIDNDEKYDIILFCHSMYGMNPKYKFVEKMLRKLSPEGMVAVFHREGTLHVDGLVCHKTACFSAGMVGIADEDKILDIFAPFVAGFIAQDFDEDELNQIHWRRVCRALGRRHEAYPDYLLFSSPEIMAVFNQKSTTLSNLTSRIPWEQKHMQIKNWEACSHRSASIMRPIHMEDIQECVRWALKSEVGLTVLGGGHGGQCLWPNVVAIDMGGFNQIHVIEPEKGGDESFIVVASGCKTGDIVHAGMAAGLIVPLGSRPSVGAGLWLQGGIGHLSRIHGLACDAIVGAVVVSVTSGQLLCVGHVPDQHWPDGAIRPDNERDLLWALKGAGTNFGVVISVILKPYKVPTYCVRNWIVPLVDGHQAQLMLQKFDQEIASKLPRTCSADAYLYWDEEQLQLGVTMFECSTSELTLQNSTPAPENTFLGAENGSEIVDSIGLFDAEMYVSAMHGGHGGGKTSSFKRCMFLKDIGSSRIANLLVKAVQDRPSARCYLHLLQGGGAIRDVKANATAFGCRDWDFACVITGVWPRGEEGSSIAQATVQWVYDIAEKLLPLSIGAYGADLGPDPRDAILAEKAFGPNLPRLSHLKHIFDPSTALAYACPLPRFPATPKLIVLVTGDHGAGKDYCAAIWASVFNGGIDERPRARVASISDVTKQEYAAATKADFARLISDRAYKEVHRSALTAFFERQVQQRPQLPQESFLRVIRNNGETEVLFITGMRDEAPVASFSQLVPSSRVLEIRVVTGIEVQQSRMPQPGGTMEERPKNVDMKADGSPNFIFDNNSHGKDTAKAFAKSSLFPFVHHDLHRLAKMIRRTPDYPRHGTHFHHILGISQQPGGLTLCTSLLRSHFDSDWAKIDFIVSCEAGGFVFASSLASSVDVPLVLIREAGKLPQPTISVSKPSSYISNQGSGRPQEKRIEVEEGIVPEDASVVVVDDVLSTGNTLCAVLQLLKKAGLKINRVSVMIVAEFPVHRGREMLRQQGFGCVRMQSLLVFGDA